MLLQNHRDVHQDHRNNNKKIVGQLENLRNLNTFNKKTNNHSFYSSYVRNNSYSKSSIVDIRVLYARQKKH